MTKEIPLVHGSYLLEKFPGKGGWTYAAIPQILQNPKNPFGWVRVKGTIDGYLLQQYKLMPMGEGRLFLPIKASIRKALKKQAGDYVSITLYHDSSMVEIPKELLACFEQELPEVLGTFMEFTEGQRKAYIDWVYAAKTDPTKVIRIVKMMERLGKGLKFHEREKKEAP